LRRRNSRNTRISVCIGFLQHHGATYITNVGFILYVVVTLYHNACEHCKESFQRIGVSGMRVLKPSQVAGAVVTPAHASSPSVGPRFVRIPRISLPGSSTSQGSSTPRIRPQTPEPGSSKGVASRHVSAERIPPSSEPSEAEILTSPGDELELNQARYFVKFHAGTVGKPTLQVKLEHVWSHETVTTSVKFSPDGKYLAVGLTGSGMDSQSTYIYDVAMGRKISSVRTF
jgi:hypothetical protein